MEENIGEKSQGYGAEGGMEMERKYSLSLLVLCNHATIILTLQLKLDLYDIYNSYSDIYIIRGNLEIDLNPFKYFPISCC